MTTSFSPPVAGPGAVYLPSCRRFFEAWPDLIKVAEVEPQPLWVKPAAGAPRGSALHLAGLRQLPQTFLMHGVGAPFAGLHGCELEQIPEFKRWADWLNVGWTSEHMSLLRPMGSGGPINCGFLMPPLQCDATVECAARNIRARAVALGRPVAFETGVNYFAMRDGEMSDGEFWSECARTADCGILLDISNIWVNARNGRSAIDDVLKNLPLDRVWEVHVAGAQWSDGYWLDAHCGAINPDILAIANDIIPCLPNLAAIIFEVAPDHVSRLGESGFMSQMESVNRLWSLRLDKLEDSKIVSPTAIVSTDVARHNNALPTVAQWEAYVSQNLVKPCRDAIAPAWHRQEDEQTFALYAGLILSARRGTIAELLEYSVRLLLLALGDDQSTRFIDVYCESQPAQFFASEEARNFAQYALANDPGVVGFADLVRFEAAMVEAVAEQRPVVVSLNRDIEALIAQIDARQLPIVGDRLTPVRIMIETSPEPRISRLASS